MRSKPVPSIYSSACAAIDLLGRGGHYASMLRSLLGSLISAFKTRRSLALENLALRQQLAILQRSVKRSRLTDLDRGFWVLLRRVWTDWNNVLVIVKPETVVRWHRAGSDAIGLGRLLMPSFPKFSHPGLEHGLSWMALMTQVYRVEKSALSLMISCA